MQTIWKWTLEATDHQTISVPKGTRWLTVQTQYDDPQLWGLCDPDETEREERHIFIHGTGRPISQSFSIKEYIGTFQLNNGTMVFHVFEKVCLRMG